MSVSQGLRLVFAGTPDFAAHHLSVLLADGCHHIVAVYTQPDRPAGRGKKLAASPVKQVALEHGIAVYQPLDFKSEQSQPELAALNADLMIVVAYGIILPKIILDTPRLGCINVHASLLPRWRGAAPIQRAIEAGDQETGITIMQMDVGLDTGDIVVKAHLPLETYETAASLHDKLAAIGPSALRQALQEVQQGTAVAEVQENAQANYARKLSKKEALINWTESVSVIERKIRAFNPFPVAVAQLHDKTIRIWAATAIKQPSEQYRHCAPGTILSASDSGIVVSCSDGGLMITELQLPGKKRLAVADVLRGQATLFVTGAQFQ
jgi:methionyl-tRNA formyltransferase